MDNWFSRPDLFHKLCSKQTDAMGTLCQNRKGVLAEIKRAKLIKGGYVSVYKGRIMIMKWKNEKDHFISNIAAADVSHLISVPPGFPGPS
jgi:hypothetical protein